MVHCGLLDWCIVGYVHQVYWSSSMAHVTPQITGNLGPCITNVFAIRRKNFSQWYRSFQRKLLSHWLKFLRHVAITLVIQGPGRRFHVMTSSCNIRTLRFMRIDEMRQCCLRSSDLLQCLCSFRLGGSCQNRMTFQMARGCGAIFIVLEYAFGTNGCLSFVFILRID